MVGEKGKRTDGRTRFSSVSYILSMPERCQPRRSAGSDFAAAAARDVLADLGEPAFLGEVVVVAAAVAAVELAVHWIPPYLGVEVDHLGGVESLVEVRRAVVAWLRATFDILEENLHWVGQM